MSGKHSHKRTEKEQRQQRQQRQQNGTCNMTNTNRLRAVSLKNIVCFYNVFQADLGRVALLEA